MEESRVSPRTVYVGIVLLVGLLVGLYFVYQVYEIVLAFVLTVLLSIVLSVPVDYLARRGLPRTLGTLAVVVAIVGAIGFFSFALAPTIREQFRQFSQNFPGLSEQVNALVDQVEDFFGLDIPVGVEPENLVEVAQDFLTQGGVLEAAAGVGITLASVISMGVVVLLAVVYLVARPEPWVNGFVSLFPAEQRQRVREVLEKLYRTAQRWLLGQLTAMTFIGVSSVVALHTIGIPFALLLGIFSGLISFVPILGAILSAVPPVLLALASEPILAVWVILAYTIIQQIESNIIQPIVMSQAVRLHPALVLFALLVMGTLFGVVGLVLAVPLVATFQVLVNELWVKRMDQVGEDPDPPDREGGRGGLPDRTGGILKALRSRLPSGKSG
jgi:predicted PurR-regulated permease PerM